MRRAILFFATSIFFYVAAIITFISFDRLMGVTFLCLGAAMLCSGADYLNKVNKDKKESDTEAGNSEK